MLQPNKCHLNNKLVMSNLAIQINVWPISLKTNQVLFNSYSIKLPFLQCGLIFHQKSINGKLFFMKTIYFIWSAKFRNMCTNLARWYMFTLYFKTYPTPTQPVLSQSLPHSATCSWTIHIQRIPEQKSQCCW